VSACCLWRCSSLRPQLCTFEQPAPMNVPHPAWYIRTGTRVGERQHDGEVRMRVVLGWGHLVLLWYYSIYVPSTHSGVLIPHPASQPLPSPHGSRRLCSRGSGLAFWAFHFVSRRSLRLLLHASLGSHNKSYCSTTSTSNSKLAKQKATARGSRWRITRRMAIRT
jgi:hypothetical protein